MGKIAEWLGPDEIRDRSPAAESAGYAREREQAQTFCGRGFDSRWLHQEDLAKSPGVRVPGAGSLPDPDPSRGFDLARLLGQRWQL